MSPGNPGASTVDSEGRIKIARGMIPSWLHGDASSYCVPLRWRREAEIPQGHELEAWIVWNAAIGGASWVLDPERLLASTLEDPSEFSMRSLMFDVRIDSKDRLCCAGLFASLAKVAGRVVWIAPEMGSVSIWSNFAFQATFGQQHVPLSGYDRGTP